MGRVRCMRVWSMVLSASSLVSFAARADPGHPCAAIAADAQRLACYDSAFGRPTEARESSAASPASDAAVPTVAAAAPATVSAPATSASSASTVVAGSAAGAASGSAAIPAASPAAAAAAAPTPATRIGSGFEPEETFGLSEAQQRELVPETVKQQPAKLESIESTATLVSSRRTGEFVYTLANGQIWTQTEAGQDGYLRDGSAVSIKRAALGSYKLVSGKVSTRVRRVQ